LAEAAIPSCVSIWDTATRIWAFLYRTLRSQKTQIRPPYDDLHIPAHSLTNNTPKNVIRQRLMQLFTRHRYEARTLNFLETYIGYGDRKLSARNKVDGDA